MKRIYVAGPYSGDNVIQIQENMREGKRVCYDLLKDGYAPFCPWLDWDLSSFGRIELTEYYNYSLAWLSVSDALLVIGGKDTSKGVMAEIEEAERLGIPIVYNIGDLRCL